MDHNHTPCMQHVFGTEVAGIDIVPFRTAKLTITLSSAVFVIFGAGGVGQELAKRLVAGNSKVFLADKDVSDVKLEGAETKKIDALNSKEVSCKCGTNILLA